MLSAYLDTTESVWIDTQGNTFRKNNPTLIVGGHEKIQINLITDSTDRDTVIADPSVWTPDTSWNTDGVQAMLTIDNDYKRLNKLTFSSDPVPASTSVVCVNTVANTSDISSEGELYLYKADGKYDAFSYLSAVIDNRTITFTLSEAIPDEDYQYAAVAQPPLATAYMSIDSDLSSGILVFDLIVNSERLQQITAFSNVATVPIYGIELLFYRITEHNTVEKIKAYVWDSVALRNPQGNPGNEAEPPTPVKDLIAANVASDIARGFEFEFSVDGADWHDLQTLDDQWMRLRSKVGVNATWSEPIRLFAGAKGDKGDKGDPGSSGLEDVFVEPSYEDVDDGSYYVTHIAFAPESGKRYIVDVGDDGGPGGSMYIGYTKIVDECQIWLRIPDATIEDGWVTFGVTDKFNWVNEPDFSPRGVAEYGYRYMVISIQNNLAVCSEFTLGDENNIWYGEVE